MGGSRSPNSEAASSAPAARFIAGDPIRALLALGVFLVHAGALAAIAANWGRVVTAQQTPQQMFGPLLGQLVASVGSVVLIFLALSAYLIVRPFARAFIDGTPPPGVVRYLSHRAFRILPAFWVVLTALIVIWGVDRASVSHVGAMYVFDVNWPTVSFGGSHRLAPAWTLNVEVRFYVVVALVAIALATLQRPLRRWRWARVALLVTASAAAGLTSLFAFQHTSGPDVLSVLGTQQTLPTVFYAFVPGLLLAAIEPLVPARMPHGRLLRLTGGVIATGALVGVCAFNFLVGRFVAVLPFSPNLSGRLFLALTTSAAISGPLLYQWAGGGCWRILDNRPLHWLGTRSYSFYLIHFAVLIYLADKMHGMGGYKVELAAIAPAAFAITALLSELSYRVVERPCQRLARRIGRRPVGTAGRAAPAVESGAGAGERPAPVIQA